MTIGQVDSSWNATAAQISKSDDDDDDDEIYYLLQMYASHTYPIPLPPARFAHISGVNTETTSFYGIFLHGNRTAGGFRGTLGIPSFRAVNSEAVIT